MKIPQTHVAQLLLIVLTVVAGLLRFVHIEESPPGFYIDEAAISAQVICVRESGQNLQGRHLPLFSEVLGGGFVTPSYLYPAVVWTSVFGDSIASFRSMAAFFSFLFIIGSYLFGLRFWKSREAAGLSALSAALSPWAFQFARVAWDPSLGPTYLMWALALLWACGKTKHIQLASSGLLFALAAYCYPPLRVELMIVLPLALVGLILVEKRPWKDYAAVLTTAVVICLPLLWLTLSGEIQGRFQMLSVFNREFLLQTAGSATWLDGLSALIRGFRLLLSPSYLLIHGDANLRHSTGAFGVWSWLDALGLCTAFLALLAVLSGRWQIKIAKFRVLFLLTGYLAGVLPAAMTWESNPHALRSFGAIVFLVIGVGGGLSILWRFSQSTKSAIVGAAFVSFLLFVNVYFVQYPQVARIWFDADVTDLAHELKNENKILQLGDELKARGVSYAPMAIAYYQLASGDVRCPLKLEFIPH